MIYLLHALKSAISKLRYLCDTSKNTNKCGIVDWQKITEFEFNVTMVFNNSLFISWITYFILIIIP